MNFYWQLFFLFSLLGCTKYGGYQKENKETIFEKRLQEIKSNGIELYPQMGRCAELDGKACFQKNLHLQLKEKIKENNTLTISITPDTLWLHITVTRKGEMVLTEVKNANKQREKHTAKPQEKLSDTLQEALQDTLQDTLQEALPETLAEKQTRKQLEEIIAQSIKKALKDLSPIEAATINGIPVNCNFKMPLILKTK